MNSRIYKFVITVLVLSAAGLAQGVRYDGTVLLDTGRPVQGAGVRVCSSGSSGTPCSPTASIFTDAALSSSITQPGFQSDAQGNFAFYAACGTYDLQITGNGITTRNMKDVQLGPCGTFTAQAKRYAVKGSAPTCSVTGAGTGATCTIATGSTDGGGILIINTGTSATASGTITLTYQATYGVNGTACTGNLLNATSSWNARATLISIQQTTTVSWAWNWDNNASSLTSSQSSGYQISYTCVGRN